MRKPTGSWHCACVVIAIAALALASGCKRQNAYVPPPVPEVGVARPVTRVVTPYLHATGSAVAYNQVDLVARVEGFLQSIDYKDGTTAKRGQTLFVIEPTPYQAKLAQAQSALASAQAQLTQAAAEYDRQASLGRSDFAARSTVDQARATRDSDQANVTNQQAGVTIGGINLGYTHVTAPFDGQVTAHLVSAGNLVGVSGPTKLASIIQLDPIYVTFNVSEQDVLRIRADLARRGLTGADLKEVPVEIELANESGYPHKGTLDYAAPEVDSGTGTLMVRAIFANADHKLLPGFFARVRVPRALQRAPALLVPDTALGTDQSGRYVLLVGKDDIVEQRSVQPGALDGGLRVIEAGLNPDDRVVVTGVQRAIPGEKVQPQPAPIASS